MKHLNTHTARRFSRSLLVVGAVTLAATVLTIGATAGAPPVPYANGFETAADVGLRRPTDQAMFNVIRVDSGTDGIASASGSYHAVAAVDSGSSFLHPVRRLQQHLPGRRFHDLG